MKRAMIWLVAISISVAYVLFIAGISSIKVNGFWLFVALALGIAAENCKTRAKKAYKKHKQEEGKK